MLVFLNDIDKILRPEVLTAIQEYEIVPLLWSEKDKYISELAS